jgi:hypothetical protein
MQASYNRCSEYVVIKHLFMRLVYQILFQPSQLLYLVTYSRTLCTAPGFYILVGGNDVSDQMLSLLSGMTASRSDRLKMETLMYGFMNYIPIWH